MARERRIVEREVRSVGGSNGTTSKAVASCITLVVPNGGVGPAADASPRSIYPASIAKFLLNW